MSFAAGAPGRQTVPLKGSRWFFILSNTRFQTKMMISFSFIMFLTISIFTIFLHLNVFPQLKDEITYSNLELCVKTSESLDNHIEKIDDITKKLISNKTLMQILTKANSCLTVMKSWTTIDGYRILLRIRLPLPLCRR